MASVHEIAIKLTATTGSVQTSLDKVKERIDSLTEARKRMGFMDTLEARRTDDRIARLKRLREELERNADAEDGATPGGKRRRKGGKDDDGDNAHNKAIQGNGRLAQSFGQLSFAVEDFLAVYGTMGLQGALRASGNNLSMVARIVAGPFMGGILGAALVGIPLLISATRTAKQEQEEFAKALRKTIEANDDWFKMQQQFRMDALNQQFTMEDLLDIKSMEAAQSKLKDIERDVKRLDEAFNQAGESSDKIMEDILNMAVGGGAGRRGFDPVFDAAQDRFKTLRENFETDFRNNFRMDPEAAVKTFIKDMEKLLGEVPPISLPQADMNTGIIDPEEFRQALNQRAQRQQLIADMEAAMKRAEAAAEKAVSGSSEMLKLEQERLKLQEKRKDLLEQEALVQQEVKDLIETAMRAQGQDALNRANQSPLQRIIQGVRDEIDKLEQVMDAAGGTPQAQNQFFAARDKIMENAIKGLEGTTKEQIKVFKDAMQSGPNSAEAAESAKRAAEAQVEAAKNQKKDATNKDVVDAIKILSDTLKNGQLIAVPVGP